MKKLIIQSSNNRKMIQRITVFILSILIFPVISHSAEYDITPYNEYKPEIIGKFYRFKQSMTYLILTNSPPGFLERNNAIEHMLVSTESSIGNDVHIKEPVKNDMVFEVVSIFKAKEITPPPDDWSDEDKKEYLKWRDENEDLLSVAIELRDENGIFSTMGEYFLADSYDVTDDRNLIIRPYTYDVTPKVRDQVIKYGKRMGDKIPGNEEQFLHYVATVVSPQIMLAFQMNISKSCSAEINTQCKDIFNVHEIIACLSENVNQVTADCKNSLVNVIDSESIAEQGNYFDIELPPGTTFIYGNDANETEPVIVGAMIPDGATANSLGVIYGPGRLGLYDGKVLYGNLAHPQSINRVLVKGAIDNDVESGMLREAILAEDVLIHGIEYAGETKILFRDSEAGSVISGTLASAQTIEGEVVPAGYTVDFDQQGLLFSITDPSGNINMENFTQ